jgi:hypothetical protein
VRDDRPLIRTRDDLLELIAHAALRLQLTYLSKDQALAAADTILSPSRQRAYRSGGADDAGSPRKRRYGKRMPALAACSAVSGISTPTSME